MGGSFKNRTAPNLNALDEDIIAWMRSNETALKSFTKKATFALTDIDNFGPIGNSVLDRMIQMYSSVGDREGAYQILKQRIITIKKQNQSTNNPKEVYKAIIDRYNRENNNIEAEKVEVEVAAGRVRIKFTKQRRVELKKFLQFAVEEPFLKDPDRGFKLRQNLGRKGNRLIQKFRLPRDIDFKPARRRIEDKLKNEAAKEGGRIKELWFARLAVERDRDMDLEGEDDEDGETVEDYSSHEDEEEDEEEEEEEGEEEEGDEENKGQKTDSTLNKNKT